MAVFIGSVALLCASPAYAFHNSDLDAETKQSLIRMMDAFSAFGDSLANAQRACARGDQGACQHEQQGKALIRQFEQSLPPGMASRQGGMPQGGAPEPGGFGRSGPPPGWGNAPMGGGYGAPPQGPYGTPQGPYGNGFGARQGAYPNVPPNAPLPGYGGGMGGAPPPGAMPQWGQGGGPMQGPNR